MLIVLIAKKDLDSGFGLTILEFSRIVYYSELPIPTREQSTLQPFKTILEIYKKTEPVCCCTYFFRTFCLTLFALSTKSVQLITLKCYKLRPIKHL